MMNLWTALRYHSLARLSAILLLIFYTTVFFADWIAPYDPYTSEASAALLPPSKIYWQDQQTGQWIGPHVYPTEQGALNLETGDREIQVAWDNPVPLGLWVQGDPHSFLWWTSDRHLFGTTNRDAKFYGLGTDDQGRDQLSRLLYGGRISLSIGIVGIAITFPLGILMGGISGYFSGLADTLIMRLVEVLMTIPSIYLLVALAAVLPDNLGTSQRFLLIVLITSFIRWAGLARVIRGQVLSIKEQEFVQAARAMGGRSLYIIIRHVIPQTFTYVIISATLVVPSFIEAESVLSLIGLGIQQPAASWGNMLAVSTNASILILQPWLVWPPALLIILTVLSFNLLGEGLRDALDPHDLSPDDSVIG